MKKLCALILVSILTLGLFTGCAPEQAATTTGKSSGTTATQATTQAATVPTTTEPTETVPPEPEAPRFYYSNTLEYDRLYSQCLDGTGNRLELDERCFDVQRWGDTIYFTDWTDIISYNTVTGERKVVVGGSGSFQVRNGRMAYTRHYGDYYTMDLFLMDLETGKNTLVQFMDMGYFSLGDEYLYYSTYLDDGSQPVMIYDIATGESRVLNDDFSFAHMLTAGEDGVWFVAGDSENCWYFASADGSTVTKYKNIPNEGGVNVLELSTEGVLYQYADYSAENPITELFYMEHGGDTLKIGEGTGSYSISEAVDGHKLLREFDYIPWGEKHPDGYYENYCSPTRYFLMAEDLSITEVDVTGEIGMMFASGDFPLLDSSTARKPVTASLYNLFVKNYGYEGEAPICATTHGAWLNIADRVTDFALLAAPTEEEQAYLKSKGVEIEMKLYGGDGLVFIGNSANPVTNLTHDQIIGIYRGEITNWSELGGPDHPITVYYRDDQSGSQRLFEKLVFKGLEIPVFYELGFDIMDEMSTIVDIVMSDPYSIGYSIMTYLDDVYDNEELKVFAVNGVVPSVDSIKDSSYPYHTQGYVVIRADEPADSPARRLFNWFGSAVCNDLLYQCSVTPLQDGVG